MTKLGRRSHGAALVGVLAVLVACSGSGDSGQSAKQESSCAGRADGMPCGSGLVCAGGTCIAACAPDRPCDTANPCVAGASTCTSPWATPECTPAGHKPDGTACGSGLVCANGTCVAGSGSDTPPPADRVSSGLKIFVSSRPHVGDFLNDPYLTGGDAIQKADDFCNTDPTKPDGATYKALLVDGVIRDAKTRTNWVLAPNTSYVRPHGDVVIGSTTSSAIFGAFYAPLTSPIDPTAITPRVGIFVWTGLESASDFAAGSNCGGWSDGTIRRFGGMGIASQVNGDAFYSLDGACSLTDMHVYCVQQP